MNRTDPDQLPYRRCVGIMVLNPHGRVFVGRRINIEVGENWQMPQGGIDRGEDLKTAALRELEEETGKRAIPYVLVDGVHWVRGYHKESNLRFDPALFMAELRKAIEDGTVKR